MRDVHTFHLAEAAEIGLQTVLGLEAEFIDPPRDEDAGRVLELQSLQLAPHGGASLIARDSAIAHPAALPHIKRTRLAGRAGSGREQWL
eukprot:CAMPEP_0170598972 /NCGR_PEP_ID=MMETSP0224-20130122/16539_1 /TAXON_ID=285029 /ORGANISM="Togula jolla, Strain CCCM 725" /LENGTH=88 /DNA_ID=CAMNT_0010923573 /DNA_START=563 /DNA_END=829 /DNA_ORIENTATION=+